MGCPNARAGVGIVEKRPLEQPNFDPCVNYHYCRHRNRAPNDTNIGRVAMMTSASATL